MKISMKYWKKLISLFIELPNYSHQTPTWIHLKNFQIYFEFLLCYEFFDTWFYASLEILSDISVSFFLILLTFFWLISFFEIILGSAILFGYFRDSSQGQEVHNKRRRIAFKFFNKPQNKLDCKSVALVRWAVIGKLNRSQWRCVHGSRDPTVTFLDDVIG